MEQLRKSVQNCKDIIETLRKIDKDKIHKMYEFNFISKDDTLDLIKKINLLTKSIHSSFLLDDKNEYENLTELKLYKIVKMKLEFISISYNYPRRDIDDNIYGIQCIITRKKAAIDNIVNIGIEDIMEYIHFYERNENIIKCEDLDKDKKNTYTTFYGIKQVEPIDDRTTVMIIAKTNKSNETEYTNVLHPIEFNGFKTYKLIVSMGVAFYETAEGGIRVMLYSNGFALGNLYL